MNPVKRLKKFLELASGEIEFGNRLVPDPANPIAQIKAKRWMEQELIFLSKPDRVDLLTLWNQFIEDARTWYTFNEAINYLGEKYGAKLNA